VNKIANYVNSLVDGNALNARLTEKQKTIKKVQAALSDGIFDKYASYSFIFELVDKRKISMHEVREIAEANGIPSSVVKMRRRYLNQLNKAANQ